MPGVGAPPRVAVLLPQTYMNEAGRSVGPARGALRVALERVLVLHDEIDLPFGDIRARVGGGLAGHNGLKSLKRELGSADFARVRIGVGRPRRPTRTVVAAYVLGRFREPATPTSRRWSTDAADVAESIVLGCASCVRCWRSAPALAAGSRDARRGHRGGGSSCAAVLRSFCTSAARCAVAMHRSDSVNLTAIRTENSTLVGPVHAGAGDRAAAERRRGRGADHRRTPPSMPTADAAHSASAERSAAPRAERTPPRTLRSTHGRAALRGRSACPLRCSAPSSPTPPTTRPPPTLARERRPRVRLAVAAAVPARGARRPRTPRRPLLVVAGDDRAARDLAADLRAWLRAAAGALLPEPRRRATSRTSRRRRTSSACASPRSTRCSTTRRGRRARRSSSSPPSRWRRRSPTRSCARTASRSRVGELLDLDETRRRPRRRAATSASTRSRTAASSRSAAACSTSTRRPRSAPSASSCSTSRSSRCAGSPPSRSARSARPSASRSRPPPSSRPSTASWPRSPRSTTPDERPDVAELLPVDRFRELLDLVPGRRAASCVAAEEELAPALRDHWEDVCAALPRRGRAPPLRRRRSAIDDRARRARASCGCRAIVQDQPHRVPRPGGRLRRALAARGRAGAREARALRLPHGRRWARRGEAERAAYNLARLQGALRRRQRARATPTSRSPRRACATASSRRGSSSP